MPETIFFRDNFFSSGVTEIYNGNKERIGSLDLKSAFSSSVDILNNEGNIVAKGHFPFFSRSWIVTNGEDRELGNLRQRLAFLAKRYEYTTEGRGVYTIESEAFSREYQLFDSSGEIVAEFKRVSGFFESPVYQLVNHSDHLSNDEVIAVVMGVNMINKRNNRSNSSGGSH
ncbi:MAG: hypothetical protein LRY73_12885 [Bacillus sp. (in: Bacteria)]|nr:hypothetical protein [Bacillus sp. (in: firmicutes)]